MAVIRKPFKISTRLKDLIGRDLITNDFVAVFELAKNSFDAHAKVVWIQFEGDRIVIRDDGKGMSRTDIFNKWLFVAYSAKREGTEDEDYRDKIASPIRAFAGAKGVGRFSCDRLGARLKLSSKAAGNPVQTLEIDWARYETDAKQEFGEVTVDYSEVPDFPEPALQPNDNTGTVLEIKELRAKWNRDKIRALKRELTKLINPFTVETPKFQIEVIAPAEQAADQEDADYNKNLPEGKEHKLLVNGKVENPILDVLSKRTTAIRVAVVEGGETIESILEDRGEMIYRIREPNLYQGLKQTNLEAKIYFLNQSAKMVFARRMGVPSVQFGSIFLFRNGFRVFPVGHEHDDFFGLTHRKQQGVRRFLGSRDVIGCVEIEGVEGFDESTSRDQGLIRTPQVEELITCVREKCIRRLERYVVDITWKDKFDKDTADTSRMKLDNSSVLVAQLVSRLAASKGLQLVEYNPDLVRIVDEKSEGFKSSLNALELLAEKTGDKALLKRVDEAKARIKELQTAEAEAREAEQRAEARASEAEKDAATSKAKYSEELERNQFLMAAASLDQDTILNLHHQIIMHASDVHLGVRRMMGKLRNGASISKEDWIDFLERVSFRNSQILTASRFATKGGYKQQSAEVKADLAIYIRDYVETVSSLWGPRGVDVDVQGDVKHSERSFRPIAVGILIDNLVSNAAKARAARIVFFLQDGKGPKPDLVIKVADDGTGWPQSLEPIGRVFEKGVTTTNGSGLGLYHVKQVVEELGGLIEAHQKPYSEELDGAQLTLRVPA